MIIYRRLIYYGKLGYFSKNQNFDFIKENNV